jgi:tRNA pseudouridine synthase 2
MVVHLSPGHTTGTLVNALLAHCGLPACDAVPSGSSGSTTSSSGGGLMPGSTSSSSASTAQVLGGLLDDGELDEAEEEDGDDLEGAGAGLMLVTPPNNSSNSSSSGKGIIRPGIVHRLDRGTSGLMVVAKTDAAHAALCQQFKDRSVSRIYNAITVGTPAPAAARVATNIVRCVAPSCLPGGCGKLGAGAAH